MAVPVSFLHTADWQIGMKATHVAKVADQVRKARIEAASRIAALARERGVDFVVIAGDLFESNAIGNDVVHQVLHALEKAAPVPVFIMPGNHDPMGPGSIYERPAFCSGPKNVHVLRGPEPVPLGDRQAVLLPAPVRQKQSETDPTSVFAKTAPAVAGAIRIGIAHGSPRIEGMFQRDDHPIALDAAERFGLDYLALGHWHSWLALGSRMVMPGTPEPTRFDETSGFVALVEIDAPGAVPRVERVKVAGLEWVERDFDAEVGGEALDRLVREWIGGLGDPARTLVRVRLFGALTPEIEEAVQELGDWLSARLLYAELDTRGTSLALSGGRLRELAAAHPYLAGLLSDLATLAAMASPVHSLAGGREDSVSGRAGQSIARPPVPLFGDFTTEAAAASDLSVAGDAGHAGHAAAERGAEGRGGASGVDAQHLDELRSILADNGLDLDADLIAEAARQLAYRAGEVWR